MSLAEMEAYERERRLRRERIRRAASWAPLGAAALLLAVGGLSLWSASSGRDADRAEIAVLVQEHLTEAEEAEAEFHVRWSEVLEASSVVRVERLEDDREAMLRLLRGTVEESGPPLAVTAGKESPALFEELARDGAPGLDGTDQARLGPFEPVLVGVEGADYTYFAFVGVHRADADTDADSPPAATLAMEWTTDGEGAITWIDAYWAEGVPERS